MKKNVAGQVVGAQMTTAADGSNFTGSVTVYVTGDAGTQTIGSVGSGICTHEGNGLHVYLPAQAETNFDHVAFTFVATGAVTQTVQLYPSFPQTGDAFARLGAPAGASVSADVASIKTDTGTTIPGRLPTSLVSGRMDVSVGAYQTGLTPLQPTVAGRTLDVTATGEAGIDWANIGAPTTAVNLSGTTISTTQAVASVSGAVGSVVGLTVANLDATISSRLSAASYTAPLDAAGTRAAVGLASANLDTQLTAIDDYLDTEVAAIKAKTDSLTFTVAGQVDANIQYVNDVQVNGTGALGDEWGP